VPAEHRGEPSLRPQLFFALAPPRPGAAASVDSPRLGEAPGGDLLAAAVADPGRDRALGARFGDPRVRGRGRLGVQRPVEQLDPLGEERVDRLLGGGRIGEPAVRLLGAPERLVGADRGSPGQRQRRRLLAGLRLLWPAAAAPARRCRPEREDDEDALPAPRAADEVAPVRQREPTGELELRESEELGQAPDSPRPA
jgi:hypothetical protein